MKPMLVLIHDARPTCDITVHFSLHYYFPRLHDARPQHDPHFDGYFIPLFFLSLYYAFYVNHRRRCRRHETRRTLCVYLHGLCRQAGPV